MFFSSEFYHLCRGASQLQQKNSSPNLFVKFKSPTNRQPKYFYILILNEIIEISTLKVQK